MNRMDRLTATVLLLQDGGRTSEEIARSFEVSRRTVLRDIQALCEMGVPVIAQEGPGGGYSLPEDFSLSPLPLTLREAMLLLLALSGLQKLPDSPFSDERASLAAKLRASIPAAHLRGAEELLSSVAIEVPERQYNTPFIELLLQCAREEQWVSSEYRSANGPSTPTLLPLRIFSSGGFWYCRAFSHEHGEGRTYRVDRFMRVERAPAPAAPQARQQTLPYNHPSHPRVCVRLTPRGVLQMETEQHLGPQIRREPDGGGMLEFHCPPSELEWFARYLLRLGPEAVVESPAELRARLLEHAEKILKTYQNR